MGSIQAISHLAHALYDPESWMSGYAREEMNRLFSQEDSSETENILPDDTNVDSLSGNVLESDGDYTKNVPQNEDEIFEQDLWSFIEDFKRNLLSLLSFLFLEPPIDSYDMPYENFLPVKSETARARLQRWKYNSSIPIFITLPGVLGPVMHPLPHPLWSLGILQELPHKTVYSKKMTDYLLKLKKNLCTTCVDNVTCQKSCADDVYVSGCESSLVLLKYLVEFSARPLELMV